MGRKLKVVENNRKHLTKAEKAVRVEIQKSAGDGLIELQLTPPKHLGEIAKAEYARIVEDLKSLPVRDLDRAVLENYCTWYGIYVEASQKVNEIGISVFSEDKGMWIQNPLVVTLEKATNNIKSCAAQLGLTVDSRMKMYVPKTEEKKDTMFDKFGG